MKDEDTFMKFVKSGFMSAGVCSTLTDWEGSRNSLQCFEAKGFVWLGKEVYSANEFVAESKMRDSSALIKGESDKEEKI